MVCVRSTKPLDMRNYISIKQATEQFPVSRRTVWRWISEGLVQAERIKRGQRCQVFVLVASLRNQFVPQR